MELFKEAVFTEHELTALERTISTVRERCTKRTVEEQMEIMKDEKPGLIELMSDLLTQAERLANENADVVSAERKAEIVEMRAAYEHAIRVAAEKEVEQRVEVEKCLAGILVKLALYRNCLI